MIRRRELYSFVMVTIYVVASMLSSLSLLLCDHHHAHHPHHKECSAECCSCSAEVAISADCCHHHHPILGDNHTDYISSSQRSDSRASHAMALMLSPVLIDNISGEQALHVALISASRECRTIPLPETIYLSSATLRGPPTLA